MNSFEKSELDNEIYTAPGNVDEHGGLTVLKPWQQDIVEHFTADEYDSGLFVFHNQYLRLHGNLVQVLSSNDYELKSKKFVHFSGFWYDRSVKY